MNNYSLIKANFFVPPLRYFIPSWNRTKVYLNWWESFLQNFGKGKTMQCWEKDFLTKFNILHLQEAQHVVSLYLLLIEILEDCETKIFLTFHLIRIQGTEVFMRICSRSLLNNQELSLFVPPTMLLGSDGNRIFEEKVFSLKQIYKFVCIVTNCQLVI